VFVCGFWECAGVLSVGDGTVRSTLVTQAFRFALDPTPAQERVLVSHAQGPLPQSQGEQEPGQGRAAKLARHHARVADLRADALHKATSHLAAHYETIVVEDLNVTGMLANRRLARAVAGAGFGQVRAMLDYKTIWNGGRLVVADRWFHLRDLAASGAERQNACGGDIRPGPPGQTSAKQEPGTTSVGQTGTPAAQATAT
jgi:IS605 OrfB family transposase